MREEEGDSEGERKRGERDAAGSVGIVTVASCAAAVEVSKNLSEAPRHARLKIKRKEEEDCFAKEGGGGGDVEGIDERKGQLMISLAWAQPELERDTT